MPDRDLLPTECLMTIAGTGSYVPERVLTNAELEKSVETSDEWITTRTGIKERRIAAPGETTSDMATMAARRAMEMAGSGGAGQPGVDHFIRQLAGRLVKGRRHGVSGVSRLSGS